MRLLRIFALGSVVAFAAAACSTDGPAGPTGSTPTIDSGVGLTDSAATPDKTATPDQKPIAPDTVSAAWGPDKCPTGATGVKTGAVLGSLKLRTCEGKVFDLNQLCGASALWIFVAHEWCPHCRKVGTDAETIHASFTGKNLASVQVLVQSSSRAPPTAADCASWKKNNKLTNVLMLNDPTGASRALYERPYTALSVFVDSKRVIKQKLHTDNQASLKAAITRVLP